MNIISHSPVARYAVTGLNAGLLTLMLLYLMFELIKIDEPQLLPPRSHFIPPLTFDIQEPEPQVMVAKPEPPKQVELAPVVTKDIPISITSQLGKIDWAEPQFNKQKTKGLVTPPNQLVLILGYPPNYPQREIARNREGFVVVGFSVDQQGQVFDAHILQSEPENVFDRAALKAIAKFKYKPRLVGGKPVVTENQRYKFTFKLDNS